MSDAFVEYRGMSYEQASREGLRLVQKAANDGNWFVILDRLQRLKAIMDRDFKRASAA